MIEHIPVLLKESIEALNISRGKKYVDCTVGGGGHAQAILKEGGQLIGIDADPTAIEIARARLLPYGEAILINDNFSHLAEICDRLDLCPVDGVLFDLGMSSIQLEQSGRGLSFQKDEPLDMRFNPQQGQTAADIVNTYTEHELALLIQKYGEERQSSRIARFIIKNRPVTTSAQLANIVEQAVGRRGRIHPATRVFQALRIAVNNEMDCLESALDQAINLLNQQGRMVVISFHSLEDRITKEKLREESRGCICPREIPVCVCGHQPRLKLLNRRAIKPTSDEIKANPRSRSARMRVAERI